MTVHIPNSHKDLAEQPIVVTLVTVSAENKPHAAAVWRRYDGEFFWITTAVNSRKHKNIVHNPYISIMAIDPHNPYRYLEIGGIVEEINPDDETAFLNTLSQFYVGKSPFFGEVEPAADGLHYKGVILKIKPIRAFAYG